MNRLQLSHKLLGLCGLAMAVLALMTYVSYRSLEASDGTAEVRAKTPAVTETATVRT